VTDDILPTTRTRLSVRVPDPDAVAAALREAGFDVATVVAIDPDGNAITLLPDHRQWAARNVIPDYPARIIVQFGDGTVRTIDLSHLIDGPNAGVFENLRDESFFRRVRALDGTVSWPGEIDLDSEALWEGSR
jgi:hypothetical protein